MNTGISKTGTGPRILDGRIARDFYKTKLIHRVAALRRDHGVIPTVAIIQVGSREDSAKYISAKKKFAKEIGAQEVHMQFPDTILTREMVEEITKLNIDKRVHGILVQLPLPGLLDRDEIINTISPKKDVDGLTQASVNRWSGLDVAADIAFETGEERSRDVMWPATARGIKELLAYYGIAVAGQKVTVVGRSALVGKPTAEMFLRAGADVTIAHSKTLDVAASTRKADIIVTAVGKPGLIGTDYVHKGQVIVDVGTTPVDGELIGDVNFEDVSKIVGPTGAISPVPGGVGAMTVLALFENLVDACYNQVK